MCSENQTELCKECDDNICTNRQDDSAVHLSDGLCACILCAQRSECMPGYDDETLIWGADNGHAPKADAECARYIKGDEDTRARALAEKKEFDEYASNLIKNFGA